ncbi:SET domain-containing protein [Clathrospora elynae]|uniref:SET domain-containing protein n=1 Tax=Clathrospora elynae TaxID=706981 RepID=A0A6A5SKS5_9PLEO|nr:SET domain-containing protein [Clathrospora elynae]
MSDQPALSVAPPVPFHIAKSNICTDQSGGTGSGLFAGRRFGAGEQIAVFKRPLVGSLETERISDTCANCYVWTEGSSGTRLYVPEGTEVQKCAGCHRFRYCSKACQKEAWNRGHKHECKLLKPLIGRELPKAFLACMELLIRRKHDLISDEDWEMLCRLPDHIDDFKRTASYENMVLMAVGAGEFSSSQNMFDQDFIAAMYGRVLSNSLTLITPTLDPLGIILDPTLCRINHSCDPNAYIMMDGAEVSIRTLRPIKKDKEIYISYIDTTNPYHKRQAELQSRWFFTCRCIKCQKGATLQEDNWTVPANYALKPDDMESFAGSQKEVFSIYEKLQRLSNVETLVPALEQALQICHESKCWPLYRQPYAALRDDLIVNLLSVGKYKAVWAQCAKRYKHITPKLYPVPFHPVRVVQTWQMAMLAAYLASTEDGIEAPGVNMGLIAMMLVKQVLDAASFSHGPDSAFMKSVKSKADEMIEELKRSVGTPNKEIMDKELENQRDMLIEMGDWAKDGEELSELKKLAMVERAFSV